MGLCNKLSVIHFTKKFRGGSWNVNRRQTVLFLKIIFHWEEFSHSFLLMHLIILSYIFSRSFSCSNNNTKKKHKKERVSLWLFFWTKKYNLIRDIKHAIQVDLNAISFWKRISFIFTITIATETNKNTIQLCFNWRKKNK